MKNFNQSNSLEIRVFRKKPAKVMSLVFKPDYFSYCYSIYDYEGYTTIADTVSFKESRTNDLLQISKIILKENIKHVFANKSCELLLPKYLPDYDIEKRLIDIKEVHIDSAYNFLCTALSNKKLRIACDKEALIRELKLFDLQRFKDDRETYPMIEAILQGIVCAKIEYVPDYSFMESELGDWFEIMSDTVGNMFNNKPYL